jgi:acyl carrier protein
MGESAMARTVEKQQLFGWLAGAFQMDAAEITMERTRDSIETWDSMGTLLLIAELDDKLHVTLSEDELKGLRSIRDIVDLLQRKEIDVVG